MHLKSIELSNIRGLGHRGKLRLELQPHDGRYAGWFVVVGPNGAGKSTLLRAIAWACVGPSVSRFLEPSRAWWLSQGAQSCRVTVSLCKGPRDVWHTPDGPPRGAGERGSFDFDVSVRRWQGAFVTTAVPPSASPDTEGPWSTLDEPTGWFIAGYGPFRRLVRGSRDSERLLESDILPVARLAPLFLEDATLREPVEWLQKLELQARDGKERAVGLRPKLLGLLSDGLLPTSGKVVGVTSDGLQLEEAGRTLTLAELSDGYQTVTGVVLDLVRQLHKAHDELRIETENGRYWVDNEGIVLIDEIEAHLHPAWQRRIGHWFVEHFPNMQFIVTTHSPFICQEAATGCLVRLAGPDEAVESRVLDRAELERVLRGTADDVYLSEVFSVGSTRGRLGVETLERMSELERRLLDGSATADETADYRRLKELAPASTELLAQLEALRRDL